MARFRTRRALISVYDKTGPGRPVPPPGGGRGRARLDRLDGPARLTPAPGDPHRGAHRVPGCLDGRVKTLHPEVHAGLWPTGAGESSATSSPQLGIEAFDLLVSNLYPFAATVASGASPDECVEQIDIGGPAMAQLGENHASVSVVTSPAAVSGAVGGPIAAGGFTLAARRRLAAAAFAHTATLRQPRWRPGSPPPTRRTSPPARTAGRTSSADAWSRSRRAAVRREPAPAGRPVRACRRWPGLGRRRDRHRRAAARQGHVLQQLRGRRRRPAGRLRLRRSRASAIIKHSNPCGIAVGADLAEAHRKANACDPASAYGGVIAVNGPVTRRAGRADRRDLHRGRRRARPTTTRRWRSWPRPRTSGCWCSPRRRTRRPADIGVAAGSAAALLVQTADRVDAARRRPGELGAEDRGGRWTS